MTYIDLLNDFNQWLESNALPSTSQLMYFRLLNVFNRAGWPEYVQVDNLRMMIMTGVESVNAVTRAREKLSAAGFIAFQKGKKGSPNRYYLKKQSHKVTVSVTENGTVSVTENGTENGTHIKTKTKNKNITPISPNGDIAPKSKFTPPTAEEVRSYCDEKGYKLDAEYFVAFYASKGWKVGKDPMKDWKSAIVTWLKREKQYEAERKPSKRKCAVSYENPGERQLDADELEAIRKMMEG